MKVATYIEKCGLEVTILNALERVGVRHDIQDTILNALYAYNLKVNTRAKSRYGQVNHTRKELQLTSEFFYPGSLMVRSARAKKHVDTLLHEVAHIITRILFSYATPHGKHWQMVMRALGQNPKAVDYSHDFMTYALENKREKLGHKHEYRCLHCSTVVETVRALKNVENRHHASCGPIKGRLEHTQVR